MFHVFFSSALPYLSPLIPKFASLQNSPHHVTSSPIPNLILKLDILPLPDFYHSPTYLMSFFAYFRSFWIIFHILYHILCYFRTIGLLPLEKISIFAI